MNTINRRDFLKITAIAGAGLGGAFVLGRGLWAQSVTLDETRKLMGTLINLKLVAHDQASGERALEATFGEMERLIALFDHRDSRSELGILNKIGSLDAASNEMITVLSEAKRISQISEGAFDVTVAPMVEALRNVGFVGQEAKSKVSYKHILISGNQVHLEKKGMALTLDGIAKGFIVDQGVGVLKGLGFDNIIVEAGGDLMAKGRNGDGEIWKIGVAHPRPEVISGYLASFSLGDSAVATSGDYLNCFTEDKVLHHIVDPSSGISPTELASVTTVADCAMTADALSTAFMVCGLGKSLEILKQVPNASALFVTKDLKIVRSEKFPTS